jgi:hypothetical protein
VRGRSTHAVTHASTRALQGVGVVCTLTDHARDREVCAVLTSPHNFLRTTRAANAKPCIVLR